MADGLKRAIAAARETTKVVCQTCGWSGIRVTSNKRPCPRCHSGRLK